MVTLEAVYGAGIRRGREVQTGIELGLVNYEPGAEISTAVSP